MENEKWALLKGLLIGLAVPFVAYATLQMVAEQLFAWEILPDANTFRVRTLLMLGICCNLLPMRFFRLRKLDASMRGVVIATTLCAAVWIFYFWKELA